MVTIRYPNRDRAYAEIRYSYFFSGPEDPPLLIGDMVTAGVYFWDSRKVVSKDGETGARIRKSHINANAVSPDPTVSTATVSSNVHLAKSKTPVSASIGNASIGAPKPLQVSDNTPSEDVDKVKPEKVDSAALLVSALEYNGEKSVSVCQFSRKIYRTVDIVASIDQSTKLPYSLR